MPNPISSSNPNISLPPEPEPDSEPNQSVNLDAPGGMSEAKRPSVAPTPPKPVTRPGGPVNPEEPPTTYSLKSGSKKLVDGYDKLTISGAIGTYTTAGSGNIGGQLSLGSVTLKQENSSGATTATLSGPTAEINVGSNNSDGSKGAHIKAQLSSGTYEVTTGSNTLQVTLGVGAGGGLEASSGDRDADNDGKTEYCFKAGTAVTAGICIEPQQIIDDAKSGVESLKRAFSAVRLPGASLF